MQFFRRAEVIRSDLFPDMPLMEDVELSIRLRSLGRQVFLNRMASVSARRWEKRGSGNGLLILRLLIRYFLRRPFGQPEPALFYPAYYGKKIS
ncbi:MAG: hypothetical protein V1793_19450 [Pseudomonadota bacterium]